MKGNGLALNQRSSSYQNIFGLNTTCVNSKDNSGNTVSRADSVHTHTQYSTNTLPRFYKHKREDGEGTGVLLTDIPRYSVARSPQYLQSRPQTREGHTPPPPGALHRAPSQVTMHYTTVPQSLVSRQLGSRHHPTRSSLRRSRLLVLVKNGSVPRKYLPGVVERERLGVLLNLAQLLLGILATSIAAWRLVTSSNLSAKEDWPYYSGVTVLLSGWFGLILLLNCRYVYPGVLHHPCVFPIRTYYIVGCVVLSTVSAVSTLVSGICYILHIVTYTFSNCQDALVTPDWPVETCVCLSTSRLWRHGELVYPTATCSHIQELLLPLLWSLLLINTLSCISSIGFLYLLSSSHHVRIFKNWRKQHKFSQQSPRVHNHNISQQSSNYNHNISKQSNNYNHNINQQSSNEAARLI